MPTAYEQVPSKPIDVSAWLIPDDYEGVFPKGAREKQAILSPIGHIPGIRPNYRYLFKKSFERHPEQCWIEVLAYRVGCLMGVDVPPTFIAIKDGTIGALIEWFYDDIKDIKFLSYHDGGDLITRKIKNFDRKTGEQHNFDTIKTILEHLESTKLQPTIVSFQTNWREHWAKVFTFDAMIGNTDRHQENWGLMFYEDTDDGLLIKPSPAFDNGTSMGYEILERNYYKFAQGQALERYVNKGTHHMKWALEDKKRLNHFEFIGRFLKLFPDTYETIAKCVKLDIIKLEQQFSKLLLFECPYPLTRAKADFTIKLIEYRQRKLLALLGIQ